MKYMKIRVLLTITAMFAAVHASAQKGLSINRFFNSDYIHADDGKMVRIEGSELRQYKLTLYASVSFERQDVIKEMEQSVIVDSKKASNKEVGHIGRRLYYAFMSMPSSNTRDSSRRYIFYRNASLRSSTKKDATLVYMEGDVTMEELKNLFK